jgi:hypothetical protein
MGLNFKLDVGLHRLHQQAACQRLGKPIRCRIWMNAPAADRATARLRSPSSSALPPAVRTACRLVTLMGSSAPRPGPETSRQPAPDGAQDVGSDLGLRPAGIHIDRPHLRRQGAIDPPEGPELLKVELVPAPGVIGLRCHRQHDRGIGRCSASRSATRLPRVAAPAAGTAAPPAGAAGGKTVVPRGRRRPLLRALLDRLQDSGELWPQRSGGPGGGGIHADGPNASVNRAAWPRPDSPGDAVQADRPSHDGGDQRLAGRAGESDRGWHSRSSALCRHQICTIPGQHGDFRTRSLSWSIIGRSRLTRAVSAIT